MIIFYFPDIHHDDERRRMPPVPPQKPNFAGNKSFYRKSLIIASPLNFRQKSCPGNIFWGMGFGQRGSLRWNSFEGILVQTFLSFERCCITHVWVGRYILHPKKLSLFKFVRNKKKLTAHYMLRALEGWEQILWLVNNANNAW